MNPNLMLAQRTFPASAAELGFTANLPTDSISHDLPQEAADSSDPTGSAPESKS